MGTSSRSPSASYSAVVICGGGDAQGVKKGVSEGVHVEVEEICREK